MFQLIEHALQLGKCIKSRYVACNDVTLGCLNISDNQMLL